MIETRRITVEVDRDAAGVSERRISRTILQQTHGAEIEAVDTDEEDMTPLMHAAEWSNRTELVDILLRAGAQLNAVNPIGWTALDYAVDRGRREMAAYLLDNGAISTQQKAANLENVEQYPNG